MLSSHTSGLGLPEQPGLGFIFSCLATDILLQLYKTGNKIDKILLYMLRPLQFDSLIYGSAERSFCICKIKIKILIFIIITAPIKHFNDRPKKIGSGKKN